MRSVRIVLEPVLRVQPARHVRPVVVDQSPVQVRGVRLHTEPGAAQQRRQSTHLLLLQHRRSTQHRVRAPTGWRLGLVVARWSRSTKLLYAGPG